MNHILCGGPNVSKRKLMCKFDIMKSNFLLMFNFYHCLYILPKCYLYHCSHMVSLFCYSKHLVLLYSIGEICTLSYQNALHKSI